MNPTVDLTFTTGAIKPLECVREAWDLIKSGYWLLFGISLVGAIISSATFYVLLGAMVCGIFGCYLKKIDGGEAKFEDLWKGMKYLVPSIPIVLLFVVPILIYFGVAFVTLYSPLIMLAIMGENVDPSVLFGTFAAAIVIDLAVAVAMTVIHSFIIFAFPLLIDRPVSGIGAIKLSAKAVVKNLGGIGGLIVVNFGLMLAGLMLFCIGIYLMIPIITATNLVAYRKVFPKIT